MESNALHLPRCISSVALTNAPAEECLRQGQLPWKASIMIVEAFQVVEAHDMHQELHSSSPRESGKHHIQANILVKQLTWPSLPKFTHPSIQITSPTLSQSSQAIYLTRIFILTNTFFVLRSQDSGRNGVHATSLPRSLQVTDFTSSQPSVFARDTHYPRPNKH